MGYILVTMKVLNQKSNYTNEFSIVADLYVGFKHLV